MAINYSSVLKLPKPDAGTPAWATYWHRMADILDGGVVTVTKAAGATTLPDASGTADTGKRPIIRTTQTLTATLVVGVPAKHRMFFVENLSGGTGRLKIATASNNNGVFVPKGSRMWLRSTTTGVQAASRTDGRSTATELGLAVITATHIASDAITAAKILAGAVALSKLAGGGSYGRIMYTATGSGFPWATLARGTANQMLAMSTAANPLPAWRDAPFRKAAFSTGLTFSNGSTVSFSHSITGISNKYDYRYIRVALECMSSNLNYDAGDVVYISDSADSGANNGIVPMADSLTAIKILVASAGIAIPNKTTWVPSALDATKWRMRIGVFV